MTFEIGLVLSILVASVILFATEKLRADLVALIVLASLAVTGLVTPEEAFAGFANPAVVTVVVIFIISEGLFLTGVADFLGVRILKIAKSSEPRLLVAMMLTVGAVSAFINNVGATAVFLPAMLIIARRARTAPSKLLMPLAFASAMGGNLTLIGTPPNILASSILREYPGCENFSLGCTGFGFFDFTPMGLLILGVGTLYMAFVGRHLLPNYDIHSNLAENYHVREYLSELKVLPSSPLVGKTLIDSRFGKEYDLTIVSIMRNGTDQAAVRRYDRIKANDTLLVEGRLDKILQVMEQQGLQLEHDATHRRETGLQPHEATMAEVILDVGSTLAGLNLKQIRFREKYRLSVLALRRQGQTISGSIREEPLRQGDMLLVQGKLEHLDLLRGNLNFLVLGPTHLRRRRTAKAPLALGILMVMLLVVTLGWLHISVAALIAAVTMIVSRVINVNEAYKSIDWQSVFLIGGMLPLGTAMETTNAAKFLADQITDSMMGLGPLAILAGIYLLTAILTQTMSNAAATVLIAPIAINVALDLQADPHAYLMAVVVAANSSFLTPIAHQSNILVFGPGGYKFFDFTKVGFGLTILNLVLVICVLPLIWPLYP